MEYSWLRKNIAYRSLQGLHHASPVRSTSTAKWECLRIKGKPSLSPMGSPISTSLLEMSNCLHQVWDAALWPSGQVSWFESHDSMVLQTELPFCQGSEWVDVSKLTPRWAAVGLIPQAPLRASWTSSAGLGGGLARGGHRSEHRPPLAKAQGSTASCSRGRSPPFHKGHQQ